MLDQREVANLEKVKVKAKVRKVITLASCILLRNASTCRLVLMAISMMALPAPAITATVLIT